MEYKVGDKVLIKSLDWYNKNKDEDGIVELSTHVFTPGMSQFCGKIMTIEDVFEDIDDNVIYYMEEIDYDWTGEMIEGVEDETKPKFKVGDKITNGKVTLTILTLTPESYVVEDTFGECGTLYFNTKDDWKIVEEETPKFKVNDIVFVKNIGWVRITNSYWDSLANEYIYEAIGSDGEGEYDCISQSNIECQMLPEPENPHTGGNKITLDEYKNNDKEWLFNKLAMLDNITALETIQDIFNHLQQSKYPKTYEECCKVLEIEGNTLLINTEHITDYEKYLASRIGKLHKLIICRDAYWKIAGEEMGLGKPWEPDYRGTLENGTPIKYVIYNIGTHIVKERKSSPNHILSFPTPEMRDDFYESFKTEIEKCKELL